jgi:tetratricopeptide (TPR) repeat protein
MKLLRLMAALAAALTWNATASAAGEIYNPFQIATPEEQPLVLRLADAVAMIRSDPKGSLAATDVLLAELQKPTQFRGSVQLARAMAFAATQQFEKAVPAIDEAIRLQPTSPVPKLFGTLIFTFTGNPGRAADLWLAASRESPDFARTQDAYVTMALLGRLDDSGDRRRADLVRVRLIDIGYPDASDYVIAVIRSRMKDGDVKGAQELIPSLVKPVEFASLLSDNKFRSLWPNIEAWAGAQLEGQWQSYLEAAKRRWDSSRSFDSAVAYALALDQVDDQATIIAEFEPALTAEPGLVDSQYAQFLVATVGRALIATGRVDDGFKLFERFAGLWPFASDVRGLNVESNWAKQELEQGRYVEAVKRIDAVIQSSVARGPEINSSALAAMHAVKVCALHKLSRYPETVESIALITSQQRYVQTAYLSVLACTGHRAAAKSFLLGQLADPDYYPFALDFVQPRINRPTSAYLAEQQRFYDELRKDVDILRAVDKVGRKLSFPIGGLRSPS